MTRHEKQGTYGAQRAHGAGAPGRFTVLLLAVTCGVAVGNVYFPQALSPLVANGLGVPQQAAATVVTAVQFGYAAGIFLLVPLGDRVPHRALLGTLLACAGMGLLAASVAPALPPLVAAAALTGLATVAAPVIGPLAAGLVPEERRGVVSGTLLSGSLGGMLLSRTLGGVLGDWLGWRAPYVLAGALSLALAVLLARTLPATAPPSRGRYAALLAAVPELLRTEPALRRSCFYQSTVFAAFSAVWTAVALLLTGHAYGFGSSAVGALALVNAVTMCCTPVAGKLVDRHGPDPVNLVCLCGVIASAVVLAGGGMGGTAGLATLVAGTVLLDVGMQSGMVANQIRIYALRPEVRSRLSTAYMTCAYLGGCAGSWLGATAYARAGWTGVCGLVALLATPPLLTAIPVLRTSRARKRDDSGAARRSASPYT